MPHKNPELTTQSRFTGDGADLVLLHWLRHAELAIETLTNASLIRWQRAGN